MEQSPAAGERRPVSVFFVDVVGSTTLAEGMDPEDWAATMERSMAVMVDAVERYDGWVASHTGDGLLAFFGIPDAHEDDPARAVSAALDLIAAIARRAADDLRAGDVPLEVRIGINTGEVVIRDVAGAGASGTARMYGDTVNVAARMQAEAPPGGILITADTFARLPAGVTTSRVGPVQVKGKTQPVEAYAVTGRTGTLRPTRGLSGLASPMVGRDAEFTRLAGLLTAIRAGIGRTALVVGEPGIGKSRLLREFEAAVTAAGVGWVGARTVSYGRNLPLHLAIDLVRSLLELPEPLEALPPAEAAARLEVRVGDLVGPDDAETGPLLAHLLSLPLPAGGADQLARMEPRTVQRRTTDALMTVLAAAASRRPLVIVCDDLHWADDASVDLVEPLLGGLAGLPIAWVLSSRADRDVPGWRLVNAARDASGDALIDLRLEPLTPDDGRRLVANLLEIESLPEATRQRILDRAEGNPLFVEEIIRMLIDRGAIVWRDGRWEATAEVAEVDIPATLHGLLLARLDRLADDARRILRVASVIGRRFAVAVLARVAPPTTADAPAVGRALGALEGAGLIELAATEPELEYLFRHVLIQDAAYGSLLRQERRTLHAQVASTLLELYPAHREDLASVLAHHYELAEDRERALEFLALAARRARDRFARHEAYELAGRAIDLLPADDALGVGARRLRADLRMIQAEAGADFVPLGEQLPILEAVAADAAALGDPTLGARAHLGIAVARAASGDQYHTSPALAGALEAADRLARSGGSPELIGLVLAARAQAHHAAAEFAEAIELMERAAPMLVDAGQFYQASILAGQLGTTYGHVGDFDRAVTWTDQAYELGRTSGDPNAMLDADLMRSIVESLRGDPAAAIDYAGRAVREATRVDNKACAMVAHGVIGEERLRLGEPDQAVDALQASADLAAFCQFMPLKIEQTQLFLQTARAELGVGQVEFERYERVLELARRIGDRLAEGQLFEQRAHDQLRRDQIDQARLDLERAAAVFEDVGAAAHLRRVRERERSLAAPPAASQPADGSP